MKSTRFYIFAAALACSVTASAQWINGQDAAFVIGQPDFVTNSPATTAQGLRNPVGAALDAVNNKLYIADFTNNRVLRYAYPINSNTPAAELVFGQTNFTSSGGGSAANKIGQSWDIAVDATGSLYVADSSNHRVLIFDAAHTITTNGPSANRVLGQTAFNTGTAGLASNRMSLPRGLHIDSQGSLWVTEHGNNRVLRFDNAGSKATGAAADFVLGQTNFVTATNGLAQNKLAAPSDTQLIGTSLFVSDTNNNRILRFDNVYSKANGANADGVLGQANFVSSGSGLGQSSFWFPHGLAADRGGRLYVQDHQHHRVLIFNNAVSKTNGANADNVLGQLDFSTGTRNTTIDGLNDTYYSVVDEANNRLITAQSDGHRASIFQADAPLPVSISTFSIE